MSECVCGSRKQPNGRTTINPNEIGVICSLFGATGEMCRLLDLIPSAITKLAKINPNNSNQTSDIVSKILRKAIAKLAQIVLDDSGDIDVASFCQLDPPPQPEDITYADVFIFIADLVPILNYFFLANDILSGNSTRLLDKIVAQWLRQQWYLNCECKRCEDPPPFTIVPPNDRPPFTPPPQCNDGSNRCKNLELSNEPYLSWRAFSCIGFWRLSSTYEWDYFDDGTVRTWRRTSYYVPLEYSLEDFLENTNVGFLFESMYFLIRRYPDDTAYPSNNTALTGITFISEYPQGQVIEGFIAEAFVTDSQGNRSRFGGDSSGYSYPPCPPPPPPPPPPEFCEIFPQDSLCCVYGCSDPSADNYDPLATCDDGSCIYGDCQKINVTIQEFAGCGLPTISGIRQLFDSGEIQQIGIQEFAGCGLPRISGIRQLYICTADNPEIYGCTDPSASNYDPTATIDNASCFYDTYGCTDPSALNWDSRATIDDGSCYYWE